jgi:hypothetical protein
VHPVEVADGHHGMPELLVDLGDILENHHGTTEPLQRIFVTRRIDKGGQPTPPLPA